MCCAKRVQYGKRARRGRLRSGLLAPLHRESRALPGSGRARRWIDGFHRKEWVWPGSLFGPCVFFVSFAIGVPMGQGTFFEFAMFYFWATKIHALSSWPRIFVLFAELFAHSSGRSGGPFCCRRISWKKAVFFLFVYTVSYFFTFSQFSLSRRTDRPGRVLGAVLHSAKISAQL